MDRTQQIAEQERRLDPDGARQDFKGGGYESRPIITGWAALTEEGRKALEEEESDA